MPRYKYYADYDGGSLIADSIDQLCAAIKAKFSYLEFVPDSVKDSGKGGITDEDMFLWNTLHTFSDPGYFTRNVFAKKRRGTAVGSYAATLLNSDAFKLGYEYWIIISRFEL